MRNMNNDDVNLATTAMQELLRALGQDLAQQDLKDTPSRVVRFLSDFVNPQPFNFTTFEAEDGDSEMIVQHGIPFKSLCAHHLLPFVGEAVVAYVPDRKLAGLSKLARAVQFVAHGLRTQERITTGVAKFLMENLEPHGVAVLLRAEHMCMTVRGVQAPGTLTTTSCLLGCFREDARTRAEFLALARGR